MVSPSGAGQGELLWVQTIGDVGGSSAKNIQIHDGFVYVLGEYGLGTFLLKLDREGAFISVWDILHDNIIPFADSFALDALGNVYVIGRRWASIYDDGSISTSGWSNIVKLLKLSPEGDIIGSDQFSGEMRSTTVPAQVVVDDWNTVYVASSFQMLTAFQSHSVLRKYRNMELIWSVQQHGMVQGLATGLIGSLYVTELITRDADLDPGEGVYEVNCSRDHTVYIQHLDTDATLLWATSLAAGEEGRSLARGIVSDDFGSVYVAGSFRYKIDFVENNRSWVFESNGVDDSYVVKFNQFGGFNWAVTFGGQSGDDIDALAIDSARSVYTAGDSVGVIDLDLGGGSFPFGIAGKRSSNIIKISQSKPLAACGVGAAIGCTYKKRSIKNTNAGHVARRCSGLFC